jgi:uncharacterized protein (TIGR02270 family)
MRGSHDATIECTKHNCDRPMLKDAPQPIPVVVAQHAEETAILRGVRSVVVRAPHVKLHQLRRLDDRIAAHLDGLAVAGELGWKLCEAALENPGAGEVFAAAVRAIEEKRSAGLDALLALAEAVPASQHGLISAFGWVSAQFLQGTIRDLIGSPSAFRRQLGIAACAMHRVDPGAALSATLAEGDARLRARGLRIAGESARRDLLAGCLKALTDEDAGCRFWAARSALILGERVPAIRVLHGIALQAGPHRANALQCLLKAVDATRAHALLKTLAQDGSNQRLLIQSAGIAGDPHYVPWLVNQMGDPQLARLAGESFTTITGLDLAHFDLESKPPADFQPGPTDNPEDENVDMDPDDSLPWPDAVKILRWWEANGQRFQSGVRYFMGSVPAREHCLQVLKEGFQRQRTAAAQYLCLLEPGTPLFNTRAPAWRQERWLATMN